MAVRSTRLILLLAVVAATTCAMANSKSPSIDSVSPTLASAGSNSFVLYVSGSNFNGGDRVSWNGTDLLTIQLNSRRLVTVVPASAVAQAGIVSVAVRDSRTQELSNAVTFIITQPNAPPASVAVAISPAGASLAFGGSQQFTASVSGTTNTAVTWSATGGTISSSGFYTAPNTSGSYTVSATSVADRSKSASAKVTVAAPVGITIAPTTPSVSTNATVQFTAVVTGASNTFVSWSATGGGVSSTGLYTAPSAVGTYTVTATSAADATKSASAKVTVAAPVGITIAPATSSVSTNATVQFTAAVTGSSNTGVNWSATGGTISSTGLYTAPSAAGTYTVTATSAADATKSASAKVTVAAPVAISITPTTSSVSTNGTVQFTAAVTGSSNTGVNWSATSGTISSSGLYTAPSAAGTYTVTATSAADATKSASAKVTVAAPVAISITPTTSSVSTNATVQFTAAVTGSSNTGVNWSATSGTISSSGLYTAPSAAGTYTVTATSAADATKSASAKVTVAAPVAISITPTTSSVSANGTVQFTAAVTGSSNTGVNWSATSGTISSSGLYTAPSAAGTYTVTAASMADATKSAGAKVTVTDSGSPACTMGTTSWLPNLLASSQTRAFSASFDVTPQANLVDANVAFSQNAPAGYTDLAAIVRFNPWGYLDVMNGDGYRADYLQAYSANSTYHFVVVVNLPAHSYSVYVTPAGGTQQRLATSYAFRTPQSGNTSLNYWTSYQDPDSAGPLQVCNIGLAAVPTGISISPASPSLQPGDTQQFTATVSGTTNTGVTWTATDGTISAKGMYTAPSAAGSYTVSATSVADPSQSASANVKVADSTPSSCTLGATTWIANSLASSQSGSFSASFDATPQANGADSNIAFSQNVPHAYTDLAVIVRFNPYGYIDVMNGNGYRADYLQPYSAKSTYQFQVAVNVPAHTYSVYVTPPGGTQQTLANNYAFRSPQAGNTSQNYWTTYQDPDSPGPIQVCNLSLTAAPAPPAAVAVSISPASASLASGGTRQFTASVTGATNTGVSWSATGGTVSSTGLYTAPNSSGTYTVTATSVADPTKSASAAVTVASVSVSIVPNDTSVTTGGTVQFTPTVTGSTNTAVTWAVSSGGGSVSSNGLYKAPATACAATVVATSVADPRASALANVTINAPATRSLSASPTAISFGSVLVGGAISKPVTLSNSGNSVVTVSSATMAGSGFSLDGITFPFTLAAGASQTVNVVFSPSSSGTAGGSVSFVSDAANSPATVALSGSGTAPVQHSVTLNWQSSASVAGHNVYRAQTSGGPYARLNSTPEPDENFVDASVVSGQNYYYVVTAMDSAGMESGYSNEVHAAVPVP